MKKMMVSKLAEVGGELGVERKDVEAIKRIRFKQLLFKRVFGWMAPLLAFVVGFFAGGAEPSFETAGYPYAAATVMFNYKPFTTKTKFTIFGTVIVSAVAFVLGFVLGGDAPWGDRLPSVMYGVFRVQGAVT